MLDDLTELRTFERILARGSLSAAARDLGVSLAVVSKRLTSLEKRVGQRLINRTTRKLSATDEGLVLKLHVERLLEELAEAEERLLSGRDEPHGMLRVSAPVSIGRNYLVPHAARFVDTYPNLSVELMLDDRLVDLTDERIDIAIRVGRPHDSTAVMRKLAENHRYLVAAPSYLDRHGRPQSVRALSQHACLRYDEGNAPWRLEGPDGEVAEVEVSCRLRANSGDAIQDWAIAGEGIALKSCADVMPAIEAGTLERVLPGWQSGSVPIYALMPAGRHRPTKTRLFIDAMVMALEGL